MIMEKKIELSKVSDTGGRYHPGGYSLSPPPPYELSNVCHHSQSRKSLKEDVFPLNHQQRQVPASGVTTGDCSFTANGKSSLRGDVSCGAANCPNNRKPTLEKRCTVRVVADVGRKESLSPTTRFMIDHSSSSSSLMTRSDYPFPHQSINALKYSADRESPQGSTFSSPRSSISTVASSASYYAELRHLVPSPCAACTPSPALSVCYGSECKSVSPLLATAGWQGAASTTATAPAQLQSSPVRFTRIPSRSRMCTSPAETVIIHENKSDSNSTQLHLRRIPSARQLHTNTNTALITTDNQTVHSKTNPTATTDTCNNIAHSSMQKPSRCDHLPETGPRPENPKATPTDSRDISVKSGCLLSSNLPNISPSRVHLELENHSSTRRPTGGRLCEVHGSSSTGKMHRHMRDISAAVFSQPYSEELEDPPAYKPPLPASAGRPKIPTTIATGTTGKVAEVKKKLDELAQEVSDQSLADEENFDDDEYFGYCFSCGERVIGVEQACQAMGNLYHTKCFSCNICGRTLRGKAFYHVKGKIMCEEDYLYSGFQNSADKCVACGHLIMDMILQALGKSYHPGCFRCCECSKALDGVPFTVDIQGKIYCVEDYRGVYAPKCAACDLPITPAEGSDETIRVVSMEKDFHVDCYVCERCGTELADQPVEKRCYPLDGHLLCYQCHTVTKRKETGQYMDRKRYSKLRYAIGNQ